MTRSLALGRIVPVEEPAPPTRCDALQTKLVSPLTFGALRGAGARGVAVSEAEVEAAMVFAVPQSADRRRAGRRGGAGGADLGQGGRRAGRQRRRRFGRECRSAVYAEILRAAR